MAYIVYMYIYDYFLKLIRKFYSKTKTKQKYPRNILFYITFNVESDINLMTLKTLKYTNIKRQIYQTLVVKELN